MWMFFLAVIAEALIIINTAAVVRYQDFIFLICPRTEKITSNSWPVRLIWLENA